MPNKSFHLSFSLTVGFVGWAAKGEIVGIRESAIGEACKLSQNGEQEVNVRNNVSKAIN